MEDHFFAMWFTYFKVPVDTMPDDVGDVTKILRKVFLQGEWHSVYDFIEFILDNVSEKAEELLRTAWNSMLVRENSGYRIAGKQIAEITNKEELAEIETAINSSIEGAQQHLTAALSLFANRKNPDYRNSIKESISAVEAICQALTGDVKATLGVALNVIQEKLGLHQALKSSLSSLYGYTSNADGIRHAMLEVPNLKSSDAKFMLVACSAFTNYIVSKAAEAGLKL